MKIILHNQTKEDVSEMSTVLTSIFDKIKQEKNMQLIIVDLKYIKHLNNSYRMINKVTDVLSFINDLDEDSLGDVFISIEQARKQALEYNHSFEREIGFLAVHGYLHLIGYEHANEEDENKMIIEQERILKEANLERK